MDYLSGFANRLSGSGTRSFCDGQESRSFAAEFADQCRPVAEPDAANLARRPNAARREHVIRLTNGSADYWGNTWNTPQEFAVVNGGPNFLDGMGGIF
jgi:hypothetical protein